MSQRGDCRRGRWSGRSGGRLPQSQERARSSDFPEQSTIFTLGMDLEERLHVGGTSGSEAPAPERPVPPPAAAPQRPTPAPSAAPEGPSRPSSPPASVPGSMETGIVLPPVSSKALALPSRPDFGNIGTKCKVRANHFLLSAKAENIFQYEIKIDPEVKSRAVSRQLLKKLIEQFGESHLSGRLPAYDGCNILYTAGTLPFHSKDFHIKLSFKDGKDTNYKVSITFTKDHDGYSLSQFLQKRQRECPYDTITTLDVVLREFPSQNYVTVSKSFFPPQFEPNSIGEGLECLRGYFQTVKPKQMGLTLNVDLTAAPFYKPMELIDFVKDYFGTQSVPQVLLEKQRLELQTALKGVSVQTTHQLNNKPMVYKITGLSSQSASQLLFVPNKTGGVEISVAEYFRRKSYNIRFDLLPCIQAGSASKPEYLPMEVCKIVEGQNYIKKLSDKQAIKMLRLVCHHPAEKEKLIMQLVRQNNYNNDKHANEFRITVDPTLPTIEARVLPPPVLKYHESGHEKTCHPSVGRWNMVNKRMFHGGVVKTWACLNFSFLGESAVQRFCHDLVFMCNKSGMNFNEKPFDFCSRPASQIENSLREIDQQSVKFLKWQNTDYKKLQLLIIILPEVRGSYGTTKRICETELGIVSQCCMPNTVRQCRIQHLVNLALKINVKVGGTNTVLEDALYNRIPLVSDAPTIIFGADVSHPGPGNDSSPSIAAVVASMNWPLMTKYRGVVSAQTRRQEIIDDLFKVTVDSQKANSPFGMIRELLVAFYKETKHKPHRIIFYRDGVSEGQFKEVLLLEIDAIRKACASLQEGYLPPITYVVVHKRHHTLLFPEDHRRLDQTDISGNILPGTVVDTGICHPTEFDFYLCSHAGTEGTSRPALYHVLFDENNFKANGLQSLTNNLCYTYARCTSSVSLVPPAFYAHLAALRARSYLEPVSDSGSSQTDRGVTQLRTETVSRLPPLMDNIKDVMFFC